MRWPSCPPPGHIFHRNCMQEFLRADHRCPVCRSEVPHVSHGSRAAGVIPAAADSAGVSSSQDDRPYEIGEFNVLDYSEHSAFDSRITQWQLVLDLFAQDVPVTYEMLRNEDVPQA